MKKGEGKVQVHRRMDVATINPIYTLYTVFIGYISPFKGLLGGVKQLGYHPKGTFIFPMIQMSNHQNPYDIPLC